MKTPQFGTWHGSRGVQTIHPQSLNKLVNRFLDCFVLGVNLAINILTKQIDTKAMPVTRSAPEVYITTMKIRHTISQNMGGTASMNVCKSATFVIVPHTILLINLIETTKFVYLNSTCSQYHNIKLSCLDRNWGQLTCYFPVKIP